MEIWKVWGYSPRTHERLKELLIAAENFDRAIEKAREYNKYYDSGQKYDEKVDGPLKGSK